MHFFQRFLHPYKAKWKVQGNYWVQNAVPVAANTDCQALPWSLTAADVYVTVLQTKQPGLLSSLCQDPFKRGDVCHMRSREQNKFSTKGKHSNIPKCSHPVTHLLDGKTDGLSIIFYGSQHTEFRSKVTSSGEEWILVKLYQILI